MFRASDPDIVLAAASAPLAGQSGHDANALPWVRRLNRVFDAAWRRGHLPAPRLEESAIVAAAARAEGLDRFEDERWREPLRLLLADLRENASLNPLGRAMAWGQLVRMVRARLRAERLWRAHLEILDIEVAAPIIVLGQMRSGTTRMQRLLACDPRLSHTRCYENAEPVGEGRLARAVRTWAGLAALHRLNPALKTIHPTAPTAAEEEYGLLSFSFYGSQIEAQWRVPRFARWWEGADKGPVYADFRRLLQTIAWARRDAALARRAWVLKAPQFMEDLADLLCVFPDARLLCLERAATAVVGSSASLVWNQMRVQSDRADKKWIGREWLGKTARRARSAAAVRAANRQVAQLDLDYAAMDRDWRGEMRRVYDFLGMTLTSGVQERMARSLARAERSGYRGHRYALEDFGLDSGQVERAMATGGQATKLRPGNISKPGSNSA